MKPTGLPAVMIFALMIATAATAAPIIYSQPAYESPVRAGADDLLLLPGNGFSDEDVVMFQAVGDSTVSTADIVSIAGIPYSLTVRFPLSLRADQTYEVWVETAGGERSNVVRINDPRPLWVTPSRVYSSASRAGLPRYLKVIGRNLEATRVRLTGPITLTLDAADDRDGDTAIENSCHDVTRPLLGNGKNTVRICPSGEPESCECGY